MGNGINSMITRGLGPGTSGTKYLIAAGLLDAVAPSSAIAVIAQYYRRRRVDNARLP